MRSIALRAVSTKLRPQRQARGQDEDGFLPRGAAGVEAVAAGVVRCFGGKLKRRGCPQAPAGPLPAGVSRPAFRGTFVELRRAAIHPLSARKLRVNSGGKCGILADFIRSFRSHRGESLGCHRLEVRGISRDATTSFHLAVSRMTVLWRNRLKTPPHGVHSRREPAFRHRYARSQRERDFPRSSETSTFAPSSPGIRSGCIAGYRPRYP